MNRKQSKGREQSLFPSAAVSSQARIERTSLWGKNRIFGYEIPEGFQCFGVAFSGGFERTLCADQKLFFLTVTCIVKVARGRRKSNHELGWKISLPWCENYNRVLDCPKKEKSPSLPLLHDPVHFRGYFRTPEFVLSQTFCFSSSPSLWSHVGLFLIGLSKNRPFILKHLL